MQPYLFPYIGYFQLLNAVDTFVLLYDVTYINRGWIHRNRIIVNKNEYLFTIPLQKASQNKLILDCELSDQNWQLPFLKTIEMNYKKTSEFSVIFPLLEEIIFYNQKNISNFIYNQLTIIAEYLQIKTKIIPSSSFFKTDNLKAQDKIIAICKKLNATHYINPEGGITLYNSQAFNQQNIQLNFLKTNNIYYKQHSTHFVSNISIIDILMCNSRDTVLSFLNQYTLISNE